MWSGPECPQTSQPVVETANFLPELRQQSAVRVVPPISQFQLAVSGTCMWRARGQSRPLWRTSLAHNGGQDHRVIGSHAVEKYGGHLQHSGIPTDLDSEIWCSCGGDHRQRIPIDMSYVDFLLQEAGGQPHLNHSFPPPE
jgi:hypothetical protein